MQLFFRFQITDRLAFPLLLRGLDKTDSWTKLTRAELSALETTQPIISRPQVSFVYLLAKVTCFSDRNSVEFYKNSALQNSNRISMLKKHQTIMHLPSASTFYFNFSIQEFFQYTVLGCGSDWPKKQAILLTLVSYSKK